VLDRRYRANLKFLVMSDLSITAPKKSPFTVAWLGLIIIGAIGAHFVANYDRYLPHRWLTYTSPDDSFSIQLPGKASVEPTKIPLEDGGSMMATVISASPTDHTAYMITYIERTNFGQRPPDQVLDAARDGGLRKIQGTVLTQKKITVQGYPGLDVQARARRDSLADFRIVVAGDRLFVITAIATEDDDREPKTIERILDSFKINQK
jgi:hypothetical protein